MSKRANPTAIGVFVLVAVALAVTGILVLGGLQLFREEMTLVAFFDGDVSGLSAGSPVLFRGAQLGQVSAIKVALDPHNKIAVYVKIAVKQGAESPPRIRTQTDLQPYIDRGLRAQLRVVSLVTGQLSVSLDYLPQTPVMLTGLEPGTPELPTVPTRLEQYQARLERILNALEKSDPGQLAQDAGDMVRSVRDLARSPEVARALANAGDAFRRAELTLANLDRHVSAVGERTSATLDDTRQLVKKVDREIEAVAVSLRSALDDTRQLVKKADREIDPLATSFRTTLDDTRELVRKVDREIEPLAVSLHSLLDVTRTTVKSAQDALVTVNRALDGDTRLGDDVSQAVRQVTGAARSLNSLADYLERHPEALLRGKPGPEAK
jgi:paraquat-inducible protein B